MVSSIAGGVVLLALVAMGPHETAPVDGAAATGTGVQASTMDERSNLRGRDQGGKGMRPARDPYQYQSQGLWPSAARHHGRLSSARHFSYDEELLRRHGRVQQARPN